MEGPSRKRPLPFEDEEDPNKSQMQKRVRFPKGKKVKAAPGGEIVPGVVIGAVQAPNSLPDLSDPKVAAKERADRRHLLALKRVKMTTELCNDDELVDITAAEVNYQDKADLVDDGVQMEPFNLDQEREEGYFDADGNFVEYATENQIKDAWLDSVDVDSKYDGKNSEIIVEDTPDLSSDDIGMMKRRIADLLEPEETILQALRRFKGTSSSRKEKMPEETKVMFDQLTEDSMKLMENGDYNVYHEKREVFEREAEGYERIARAKAGISGSVGNGYATENTENDIFSNGTDNGVALPAPDASANSSVYASADDFDMFGDDEKPTTQETQPQPSSENIDTNIESSDAGNGYVYDESSGYYYNSTSGYYYDSASGLFCSANSGIWYSYNEQTGIYEEVQANNTEEQQQPVS
ncbi:hypothetical protein ACHQM5_023598 [Ranunculus cassubicifolius]